MQSQSAVFLVEVSGTPVGGSLSTARITIGTTVWLENVHTDSVESRAFQHARARGLDGALRIESVLQLTGPSSAERNRAAVLPSAHNPAAEPVGAGSTDPVPTAALEPKLAPTPAAIPHPAAPTRPAARPARSGPRA